MIREAKEVFDFMRYPAGEPHVTISRDVQQLTPTGAATMIGHTSGIVWNARNFDDLVLMVTAWRTLQRRFDQNKKFIVPYFPFSRHDRRRDEWDSDPLQMALDLVRPMLDANCLITIDPHSDVSGAIPHITQRAVVAAVVAAFQRDHDEPNVQFDTIVIPDAGATKRAEQWLDLFPEAQVVQGHKDRDVRTGALTGFYLGHFSEPMGRVLIVDDICDGGGTFLGLAEIMPECDGITLLTTHGLYTKGIDQLREVFDLWTLDVYRSAATVGVGHIDTTTLIAKEMRLRRIR